MGSDDIARHDCAKSCSVVGSKDSEVLLCTVGHEGAQCFIPYCLIFLPTFLYEINIQMYN